MLKVSVIVPVYNGEKYLGKSLESILAQKFADFELICVDDGSPDDSRGVIEAYAQRDARIKYVRKENGGAGSARNHGIQCAEGKYLLFLDSDDFFEPDLIGDTVAEAEKSEADIVVFRAEFVDRNTQEVLSVPAFPPHVLQAKQPFSLKKDSALRFIDFPGGAAWNYLYNKEFILRNGLRFHDFAYSEDFFLTRTALAAADRIALLNRAYVRYQMGGGMGIMGSVTKHPLDGVKSLFAIRQKIADAGLAEVYSARWNEMFYGNFRFLFNGMLTLDAAEEMFQYAKANLPSLPSDFSSVSNDAIIAMTAKHLHQANSAFEFIRLQRELVDMEMQRADIAEEKLSAALHSKTWKIGKAVTALPKKILGK